MESLFSIRGREGGRKGGRQGGREGGGGMSWVGGGEGTSKRDYEGVSLCQDRQDL